MKEVEIALKRKVAQTYNPVKAVEQFGFVHDASCVVEIPEGVKEGPPTARGTGCDFANSFCV
jgi:hypothetical protein